MISIIVPTINRPDFVERLLEYYATLNFKHFILIGDSSDESRQKPTQVAVDRLSKKLNVSHFDCRGLNNYEVMQTLLGDVRTPYASYLADDDFLVPQSLEECIHFMQNHPDYSGACGRAVLFSLKQSNPYGDFDAAGQYVAFDLEADETTQRLYDHACRCTSVFHSVCRTEMLKRAVRNSDALVRTASPNDWFTPTCFGELLTSWSLVVQGKIKVLNNLYYIRQVHERRYVFSDVFDWITSRNWQGCYEVFQRQLREDLVKNGLDTIQSEQAVKSAFWAYLGSVLSAKLQNNNSSRKFYWKSLLKMKLRKIPGVRTLWRQLNFSKDDFSLGVLLRSSSPYHRHFLPIYKLVTKQ